MFNFIESSISRWSNRCADKIIIVGASKVTQLGVLSRRYSSKARTKQLKQVLKSRLFFCVFYIRSKQNKTEENKARQKQNKEIGCEGLPLCVTLSPRQRRQKFLMCFDGAELIIPDSGARNS